MSLSRTFLLCLAASLLVLPTRSWSSDDAVAQGQTSDKKHAESAADSETDEEAEEETPRGDPITRLSDVLTQPVPTGVDGPSWLDDRGELPPTAPGRERYKPDKALDVLYLHNGDILRGHLVPEDFPDHYAICVAGNSVVLVPEDSVLLRTKEKPLHANLSHRYQLGLSFSLGFGAGFCVSTSGGCTDVDPSDQPVDFGGVPGAMRYLVAVTFGVSTSVEIYGGGYFHKARQTGATVVDPVIGFLHYNPGPDTVKFLRMAEVRFGVAPEFAVGVAAMTGLQFDPIRNVGFFIVLGPELQFVPDFILGFGFQGGVQGRLF